MYIRPWQKALIYGTAQGNPKLFSDAIFALGLNKPQLIAGLFAIAILSAAELVKSKTSIMGYMRRQKFGVWWAVIIAVCAAIIIFGMYGNIEAQEFIYFQF